MADPPPHPPIPNDSLPILPGESPLHGTKRKTFKHRLYLILEGHNPHVLFRKGVRTFLIVLILLNVGCEIIESVPPLFEGFRPIFLAFNLTSFIFFLLEWLARLWCSVENPKFKHPVWGRLWFALHPLNCIDFIVILSLLGFGWFWVDLRFLRVFRLFPLMLTFDVVRRSQTVKSILHVLSAKKIDVLTSFFVVILLHIFASCLMYFIERDAQPEAFASIPDAMWWSIATLTTVGYGDIHPITPIGKLLAGFMALLAVGIFALPAGIFSSIFVEELSRIHQHPTKPTLHKCPHCGEKRP